MCTSTQTTAAMVKRDSIKDFPYINEVTISLEFISFPLRFICRLFCDEISPCYRCGADVPTCFGNHG
jgi:hypothetical protein